MTAAARITATGTASTTTASTTTASTTTASTTTASTTTASTDLLLREEDYAFGAGNLHLRVAVVDRAHPVTYHGDLWYRVEGVQLTATGIEIGGPREVLIRARRLPS